MRGSQTWRGERGVPSQGTLLRCPAGSPCPSPLCGSVTLLSGTTWHSCCAAIRFARLSEAVGLMEGLARTLCSLEGATALGRQRQSCCGCQGRERRREIAVCLTKCQ